MIYNIRNENYCKYTTKELDQILLEKYPLYKDFNELLKCRMRIELYDYLDCEDECNKIRSYVHDFINKNPDYITNFAFISEVYIRLEDVKSLEPRKKLIDELSELHIIDIKK